MNLSKVLQIFEEDKVVGDLIQGITYNGDESSYCLNLEFWDADFEYLVDVDIDLFDGGELNIKFKSKDDDETFALYDPMLTAIVNVKELWTNFNKVDSNKRSLSDEDWLDSFNKMFEVFENE